MPWRMTRPSSHELLHGDHRPRMRRRGGLRQWLLLALLGLIAGVLWLRLEREDQHQRQLAALQGEIGQLRATLAQQELQQREAEAAQQQLVRRNGDLAAQVKRLKTDLAFYRQQQDSH